MTTPTTLCVAVGVTVPMEILSRFDRVVSEPIGNCLSLRPKEKISIGEDEFSHRVPVIYRNGGMRMQKRWKGEMMFNDLEISSPLLPPNPSFKSIQGAR